MLVQVTDGHSKDIIVSADSVQQVKEILDTQLAWPAEDRDILFFLATGGKPIKLSESVIAEDVRRWRAFRIKYLLCRSED